MCLVGHVLSVTVGSTWEAALELLGSWLGQKIVPLWDANHAVLLVLLALIILDRARGTGVRVKGIAQPIADHLHAHAEDDKDDRWDENDPRGREHRRGTLAQQVTEGGIGRLDAQTEEAVCRLGVNARDDTEDGVNDEDGTQTLTGKAAASAVGAAEPKPTTAAS